MSTSVNPTVRRLAESIIWLASKIANGETLNQHDAALGLLDDAENLEAALAAESTTTEEA